MNAGIASLNVSFSVNSVLRKPVYFSYNYFLDYENLEGLFPK